MSHELRTPLNAVLGLSQVLQEEAFGSLNEKQHQFIDNILSSGNHLLSLINDILDLAKIESGKFELERSPTSVQFLCEMSLNFVRQQAQQKQIALELHIPGESHLVLLDERRMRQVLINLLSNGVKFTDEGGRVTLRAATYPDEVIFEVEDDGIGIADDDQNQLFQPFVQIDSSLSRRYEGTGLGLVLVKQIVALHGGQVSVTSDLGQGSCFTVRIPCSSLSTEHFMPASTISFPPAFSRPSDSSALILLAEDNLDAQQLLQDYLQVNGFQVILAENGIAAFQMAQTHLPQLILMDVQMAGMDGLQAIQQLKANSNTAMIPIIVVTASAMQGDRERCIAAGANDYLSKPVQLQQLLVKINHWLGKGT
jgi:CheY-like chemotaxis protein/anti-sigma regulatory factor (Ser/Thr protein kinase)